jgi:GNAT superfamily N-acetyltransferase
MKTLYTRHVDRILISIFDNKDDSEEDSTDPITYLLKEEKGKVEKNKKYLGFVRALVRSSKRLYLEQSYVRSNMRDKGIGKLLYLKLFAWAKKHGFKSIGGYVVEEDAIPILIRYKISPTKTTLSTDDDAQADLWREEGLPVVQEGPDYVIHSRLNPDELRGCIPCTVETDL